MTWEDFWVGCLAALMVVIGAIVIALAFCWGLLVALLQLMVEHFKWVIVCITAVVVAIVLAGCEPTIENLGQERTGEVPLPARKPPPPLEIDLG